ncbi:MAG: MoaD/ThiS family protein [Gammaproteobacteria bacterium]|nr:MoaD/ThiS family protein [Gammaproteobacteria bacterium]
MTIHVKFFASMRDLMGDDQEISHNILEQKNIKTVDDLWIYCAEGKERPNNVLIAVNMDYVDAQYFIKDRDEVAFFPPVTGG